jgi:cation transport regulator ChaB
MRRTLSKPAGEPASKYRPLPKIPAAQHLRKFASACHDLAERESDSARQELFRAMECAWEAVAAQVERADDLMAKMRATQCRSLN